VRERSLRRPRSSAVPAASGRPRVEVELTPGERSALEVWSQRREPPALAQRARLILACAEGGSDVRVAARHATTAQRVGKWRRRFLRERLDGLLDRRRSGRPPSIPEAKLDRLVALSLQAGERGERDWSARRTARELAIGRTTVSELRKTLAGVERDAGRAPGTPSLSRTAIRLRSAALAAARDLLAEGGVEAVTLAALAERVGVDPKTLRRHWRGTHEIVVEVVTEIDPADERASQASFEALLLATARGFLASWRDQRLPGLMRSLLVRRGTDPAVARTAALLARTGSELFLEACARVTRGGELRPELDPLLAHDLIVGAIAVRSVLGERAVDAAYLEGITGIVARGLRADRGARELR
jgi:AcrR family transcriptional regulator/transposase